MTPGLVPPPPWPPSLYVMADVVCPATVPVEVLDDGSVTKNPDIAPMPINPFNVNVSFTKIR